VRPAGSALAFETDHGILYLCGGTVCMKHDRSAQSGGPRKVFISARGRPISKSMRIMTGASIIHELMQSGHLEQPKMDNHSDLL
jgi:hypothetical protein